MTTGAIDRSLLEQVLKNLDSGICVVPAGILHKQIRTALAAPEQKSCQCLEPCMSCFEREKKPATAPEQCGHCGRRVIDAPWPVRDTTPKPEQPAWHDAPTCAGWWVRTHTGAIVGTYWITGSVIPILNGSGSRWYGPIQPDGEKS